MYSLTLSLSKCSIINRQNIAFSLCEMNRTVFMPYNRTESSRYLVSLFLLAPAIIVGPMKPLTPYEEYVSTRATRRCSCGAGIFSVRAYAAQLVSHRSEAQRPPFAFTPFFEESGVRHTKTKAHVGIHKSWIYHRCCCGCCC